MSGIRTSSEIKGPIQTQREMRKMEDGLNDECENCGHQESEHTLAVNGELIECIGEDGCGCPGFVQMA